MKYPIIISLVLIITSCVNPSGGNIVKGNENETALKQYLNTVPPYASFIYMPYDTLLFGFSKGATNYDTSWTLIINESKGIIRCRYNQLLPYTVSGFDDYLDESTKLISYEGFTFEIGKQRWDSIVNLSGLDKYAVKDSIAYGGCLHCPRYTAYYKAKLIVNSKLDDDYLIKLDSLLHIEIINKLFDKKRNPKIQIQKSK